MPDTYYLHTSCLCLESSNGLKLSLLILVIFCCVTNHPKTWRLQQQSSLVHESVVWSGFVRDDFLLFVWGWTIHFQDVCEPSFKDYTGNRPLHLHGCAWRKPGSRLSYLFFFSTFLSNLSSTLSSQSPRPLSSLSKSFPIPSSPLLCHCHDPSVSHHHLSPLLQ